MTKTVFLKTICKILGHEWRCMAYVFAEQCDRCREVNYAINKWNDNEQPFGFEKY